MVISVTLKMVKIARWLVELGGALASTARTEAIRLLLVATSTSIILSY